MDSVHQSMHEMLSSHGFEVVDAHDKNASEVLSMLHDFEGWVLRSRISIDKALLDQHPQLKFIARAGAGVEHIDLEYAAEKGVVVFSSPEGNRQAVAEHALGMLLSLLNRIGVAHNHVKSGIWDRKPYSGEELQGKTVGIIGYGNTGSAMAGVLSGFGVQILAYDKYKKGFGNELVQECTMNQLFERAEVVSIHLPLTDDTECLVNNEWIAAFAKPFYLVNTSRGKIVETEAVVKALATEKIRGVCLDVLEFETEDLKMPPLASLPAAAQNLIAHPAVIVTPHIAGLSTQSYKKLSTVLAEKIISRFSRA